MKIDTRSRFTLRMPTDLFELLQAEAKKSGHSVNALILQILWQWKEEKPQGAA